MANYECDCGRMFMDPDGPIMCADSGHGQGRPNEKVTEIEDATKLPWTERVNLLSIHPDIASSYDVAKMAAEWAEQRLILSKVRELIFAGIERFDSVHFGEINKAIAMIDKALEE